MTANADIMYGDGERRHLPECPKNWSVPGDCACDLLRACEQRVRQEIDREAFVLDEGDPFRQAYRKGLDAAREVVTALFPVPRYQSEHEAILAAIDALKEER